jgi:hypothetical protein
LLAAMLAFSIAGRYAGLLSALARSSSLPVFIVASANFADSPKRSRTWRH